MEKFPQLQFPLIPERNGAERHCERERGMGRADKERRNAAYGDERMSTSIHLYGRIEIVKMYVEK